MATESTINRFEKLGLFLLFLICGFLALGPLQWGYIPMPANIRAIYKISIALIFLAFTVFLYRNERFNQYWQVSFGFFVGSAAFFVAWLGSQFLSFQVTKIAGFALDKLRDALLIVIPIIVLTKISGSDMASIFLKKGNLKLGFLIGLTTFVGFTVIAIPGATILFYGQNLGLETILSWTPWIVVFVLASGMLEELLYRALFLKKYKPFLGSKAANFLQALIFALMHLPVAYTPEPYLFVVITFFLGLAWGYVMQRTDSLLGSVLFHGGADILVIIGIFSTL